jgi:hypothetical protein
LKKRTHWTLTAPKCEKCRRETQIQYSTAEGYIFDLITDFFESFIDIVYAVAICGVGIKIIFHRRNGIMNLQMPFRNAHKDIF